MKGSLGNIKRTNICIIGVPEGKEREEGFDYIFDEFIAESFPDLKKETHLGTGNTEGPKQNEPRLKPRHN